MVGRKTEKSRFNRSIKKITDTMREMRHCKIKDQANKINEMLRGHYNYYGMGGNLNSLIKIQYKAEKFWKRMLSSRSLKGFINWDKFKEIKNEFPILQPKIRIPFGKMKSYAML